MNILGGLASLFGFNNNTNNNALLNQNSNANLLNQNGTINQAVPKTQNNSLLSSKNFLLLGGGGLIVFLLYKLFNKKEKEKAKEKEQEKEFVKQSEEKIKEKEDKIKELETKIETLTKEIQNEKEKRILKPSSETENLIKNATNAISNTTQTKIQAKQPSVLVAEKQVELNKQAMAKAQKERNALDTDGKNKIKNNQTNLEKIKEENKEKTKEINAIKQQNKEVQNKTQGEVTQNQGETQQINQEGTPPIDQNNQGNATQTKQGGTPPTNKGDAQQGNQEGTPPTNKGDTEQGNQGDAPKENPEREDDIKKRVEKLKTDKLKNLTLKDISSGQTDKEGKYMKEYQQLKTDEKTLNDKLTKAKEANEPKEKILQAENELEDKVREREAWDRIIREKEKKLNNMVEILNNGDKEGKNFQNVYWELVKEENLQSKEKELNTEYEKLSKNVKITKDVPNANSKENKGVISANVHGSPTNSQLANGTKITENTFDSNTLISNEKRKKEFDEKYGSDFYNTVLKERNKLKENVSNKAISFKESSDNIIENLTTLEEKIKTKKQLNSREGKDNIALNNQLTRIQNKKEELKLNYTSSKEDFKKSFEIVKEYSDSNLKKEKEKATANSK